MCYSIQTSFDIALQDTQKALDAILRIIGFWYILWLPSKGYWWELRSIQSKDVMLKRKECVFGESMYPIAVALHEATLWITLLPSHALRSFPFLFFTENMVLSATFPVHNKHILLVSDFFFLIRRRDIIKVRLTSIPFCSWSGDISYKEKKISHSD